MKKFIAVLAALALVAGSAFAEVSWGGRASFGVSLAEGSTADDVDDVTGRLRNSQLALTVSGEFDTDVGTFGGFVWFDRNNFGAAANNRAFGEAWWRPIDMLWLGLGNDMGRLNSIHRAGDNFHRGGAAGIDRWVPGAGVDPDTGFYTGLGTGFITDVNVLDMVDIGIGLPYPLGANPTAAAPFPGNEIGDILSGIHARVRINLDGVGRIGFAYRGSADDGDNGSIFASFHSNALVPGLAMNFGVGFHLIEDDQVLDFGFGIGWGAGEQFGIGFRGAVGIGLGDGAPVEMAFQAVPRFLVTPAVSFQLPVGFGITLPDVGDAVIRFQVDPYIRVNLGWPAFVAGVHISGNNAGDDMTVNWAVPLGMRIEF